MKLRTILTTLLVLTVTFTSLAAEKKANETITVSSLNELLPYLAKDNIELKMKPGAYRISVADIKSGKYTNGFEISPGRLTFALLPFEGNNNTYNFAGVTIEVETGVASAFEQNYFEVSEVHIFGNNNIVKGLTLTNVGSVDDYPKRSWVNIIMDGSNNRLEGVEVNSRGSLPYGYGEVFGKGGPYTIRCLKHCAWLVRGTDNHVKDCHIIHHAYGHYLFIQGTAGTTIIEGCYIEGEMVSTDDILAEEGTGSAADKVDFKTAFDYRLPGGYTLSTGEDGIRTYGNGSTMIDGVAHQRVTGGNIIVRNCTVQHARTGISLRLGEAKSVVENCTLIGCQDGYSVNNGDKIINCRADAEFGPALRFVSDRDRNIEADITIMPYKGKNKFSGNGSKNLVHIFGSGHNITLRKGKGLKVEQDMYVSVGGDSYTIGNLAKQENYKAHNITLVNETGYPVVLDDNTQGTTVTTNGEVTDNGTNNIIKK